MRQGSWARLAAALGFAFLAAGPCSAAQPSAKAAWTQSGGPAKPPAGYLSFCRTTPDQCLQLGSPEPETMTAARWRQLVEVNTLANLVITPMSDEENYHLAEVWALPKTAGDCEDYALLKRKWLIDRGWPTGALLLSVVFDEVGEGHAVLVARTSGGDFVLDNKTEELRRWTDAPYRFVKRQSVADPNRWVMIGPASAADPATASRRH